MAHSFTRSELYELVWSEPMKTLAARFKISDVGLSKACRRYDIPVPERGYWAKLKAGKKVHHRPLPLRGPGMSDEVTIGAGHGWHYRQGLTDQQVLETTPSPPTFDRDLDEIISEVRSRVGRVAVAKGIDRPHRLIAKLLEADDEKRRKAATQSYVPSWEQPQFDSPFERRRLRLLNAIFTALERLGMQPSVGRREARDLSVRVNDTSVSFSVDDANAKIGHYAHDYERCRNPSGRMKVVIRAWRMPNGIRHSWEDKKNDLVEKFATDIAVELIVTAERQLREGAQHHYEWMLEHKAALIEEIRRRKEEAERKERERLARLERERVERLLADADALRRARDIRDYVDQVKALCGGEQLQHWADWALVQADHIDPVVSGGYLESMKDRS